MPTHFVKRQQELKARAPRSVMLWAAGNGPAFRPRLPYGGKVIRDKSRFIRMPNMREWRRLLIELERQAAEQRETQR